VSLVLGIDTSCDDTGVGVVRDGVVAANVVVSQTALHARFGGVVPEQASREHLGVLDDVVGRALRRADAGLDALDAVAVTFGPGLVGALLVGLSYAKALAWGRGVPLLPVHHLEAHIAGAVAGTEVRPPFLCLIASGGHTALFAVHDWQRVRPLGHSRDDAAGEAFDKVAKLLGLPYPGGPQVEKLALQGDPARHRLPRPMLRGNQRPEDSDYFDFSFSGLKTAVAELARKLDERGLLEAERAHVAASFQEAAVDVLASKVMRAVEEVGCPRVLVGGGVSANGRLRDEIAERLGHTGSLFRASTRLSLDNGAMVARTARFRYDLGQVAPAGASASADLAFPGLTRRSA
jgi:N6-L-threonylcarbamoyladenine synthase